MAKKVIIIKKKFQKHIILLLGIVTLFFNLYSQKIFYTYINFNKKLLHLQTTTNYVVVCKYKYVGITRKKQICELGQISC